jgi:hypothetical protein
VLADDDTTKLPTHRMPRIQFTPPPPTPRELPRMARATRSPPAVPVAFTVVRPLVARREPTPHPLPLPLPVRPPIRWDVVLIVATTMILVMSAIVALAR